MGERVHRASQSVVQRGRAVRPLCYLRRRDRCPACWSWDDLHREHAQVVNEFLAHLDDEDPNFLLIAATNRADLLDEAATRRGRFDQQYEVGLPDKEARKLIFKVRLRELPSDLDDDDYETLAEQTADRSAADIVGMVDDAAMRAAERDAEAITKDDLLEWC